MDSLRVLPPDFFSELQADGRIETAILLKRNGRMLASWTRAPVSLEIATIMAATALGSVETMMESLQVPPPQTISIQASGLRIFLQKAESQSVLVLVAKEAVPEAQLRDAACRLISKLPSTSNRSEG
jgi:predicted regulator of Ras-like GTPase activity (Roadblock/LC7/MglB family)